MLMIAHYTAVYTKEVAFIQLPLGLLLPSVLQNIWTEISSLSLITGAYLGLCFQNMYLYSMCQGTGGLTAS